MPCFFQIHNKYYLSHHFSCILYCLFVTLTLKVFCFICVLCQVSQCFREIWVHHHMHFFTVCAVSGSYIMFLVILITSAFLPCINFGIQIHLFTTASTGTGFCIFLTFFFRTTRRRLCHGLPFVDNHTFLHASVGLL